MEIRHDGKSLSWRVAATLCAAYYGAVVLPMKRRVATIIHRRMRQKGDRERETNGGVIRIHFIMKSAAIRCVPCWAPLLYVGRILHIL